MHFLGYAGKYVVWAMDRSEKYVILCANEFNLLNSRLSDYSLFFSFNPIIFQSVWNRPTMFSKPFFKTKVYDFFEHLRSILN